MSVMNLENLFAACIAASLSQPSLNLYQLFAEDRTEEAISLMINMGLANDSEIFREMVLHTARLNRYQTALTENYISYETFSVTRSRVLDRVIQLAQTIQAELFEREDIAFSPEPEISLSPNHLSALHQVDLAELSVFYIDILLIWDELEALLNCH